MRFITLAAFGINDVRFCVDHILYYYRDKDFDKTKIVLSNGFSIYVDILPRDIDALMIKALIEVHGEQKR